MSFIGELQRRKVFKVGAAYAVVAWLLIQIAVTILPTFNAPEWITQTVVFLLILGLPVALLLAWAYELTPEGIRPTTELGGPLAPQRKLLIASYAAAGLLAIVATFVGVTNYLFRPGPAAPAASVESTPARPAPPAGSAGVAVQPSVAVLPFEDLSEAGDQEYFSSGISEELLNALADVDGLRVPSRTSSFSFKGTGANLPTIAAALDVSHVLEGTVRKAGNQVRVSAKLVEARTDTVLWESRFTQELVDIFAIQDEIAANVVAALRIELLGEDAAVASGRRTDSIEAYDAYLQGVLKLAARRTEDLAAAREHFREASEHDPDYAAPYAALADSYLLLHLYGTISRGEMRANAEPAIARALQLDPNLGQAIASRALAAYLLGDSAAAEVDFRRAIERSPNYAQAYLWYSLMLRTAWEDPQRSLGILEAGLETDPRAPIIMTLTGQLHSFIGEHDRAHEYFELVEQIAPDFPTAHVVRGWFERATGSDVAAHALHRRSVALDPGNPFLSLALAISSLGFGDREQSREWLDRAADLMPDEASSALTRELVSLVLERRDPERLTSLLVELNPNFFIWADFRTFAAGTLAAANLAGARRVYARMFPELLDGREIPVNALNVHAAVDVAWILQARGETQRAEALLERCLEVMRDRRGVFAELHLTKARALALLGRQPEALANLKGGAERGYYWWLAASDPALATLGPELGAVLKDAQAAAAARFAESAELSN